MDVSLIGCVAEETVSESDELDEESDSSCLTCCLSSSDLEKASMTSLDKVISLNMPSSLVVKSAPHSVFSREIIDLSRSCEAACSRAGASLDPFVKRFEYVLPVDIAK